MSETVKYDDSVIMDTFKREVCSRLGEGMWDVLTTGIGVPNIHDEGKSGCQTMRQLMERFDRLVDGAVAKEILAHVRHGLTPDQFLPSARERLGKHNDFDEFLRAGYEEGVKDFTRLRDTGKDFYGQPITDEVLQFVMDHPTMLSAKREGSKLHITAFPANMAAYLRETDDRMKRYHACHCPFAKESILRAEGPVSKTICNCSLGHAKVFLEAALGVELGGDVVESVLDGGLLCRYVVYLPDEVMTRFNLA